MIIIAALIVAFAILTGANLMSAASDRFTASVNTLNTTIATAVAQLALGTDAQAAADAAFTTAADAVDASNATLAAALPASGAVA